MGAFRSGFSFFHRRRCTEKCWQHKCKIGRKKIAELCRMMSYMIASIEIAIETLSFRVCKLKGDNFWVVCDGFVSDILESEAEKQNVSHVRI